MENNTNPTYGELRLKLAKVELELARTTMAYNLLHAATQTPPVAAYLPGPRWTGAAH